MNPIIGKISSVNEVDIDGIIFKGEWTRLVSKLNFRSEAYGTFYMLRVTYEVKEGRLYHGLFSTTWEGKFGTSEDKDGKYNSIRLINPKHKELTLENEGKILNLKKSKFNGAYFGKSVSIPISNPIVFCEIPFLEEPVKNWILMAGLQDLTIVDIKKMLKGVKV